MIYGINNNSLTDVEEPGEEAGCGHGGIVFLLGKKKKKVNVNYFPKRCVKIQMSSCSSCPYRLAAHFKDAPCSWHARRRVLAMLPAAVGLPPRSGAAPRSGHPGNPCLVSTCVSQLGGGYKYALVFI